MVTFSFSGKQVWVTGCDTTIGCAVADSFELAGASVLRSGVDGVPNPSTLDEAMAQIEPLSRIDILLTANRYIFVKSIKDTDVESFDDVIAKNLKSVFCAMQTAVRKMSNARVSPETKVDNGVILVISSIHGEKPNGSAPIYSMACGGLNMLVREAAQEYGRLGIRVNLLAPGPLLDETLLFPSSITSLYDDAAFKVPRGRLGSPDEVASTALFLCSDMASLINGAHIPCDGGFLGYYIDADVESRLRVWKGASAGGV